MQGQASIEVLEDHCLFKVFLVLDNERRCLHTTHSIHDARSAAAWAESQLLDLKAAVLASNVERGKMEDELGHVT